MDVARRSKRAHFAKERTKKKERKPFEKKRSIFCHDLVPVLRAERMRFVSLAARKSGESDGRIDEEKGSIAFEPNAKKRAMRKRSSANIVTPTKDASIGKQEEMPLEYQLETAAVAVLVLLFLLILLGGIFLGASAFLSEDLDRFAQEVVYPNYSKVVVAFLLGSTAYGFYKSR